MKVPSRATLVSPSSSGPSVVSCETDAMPFIGAAPQKPKCMPSRPARPKPPLTALAPKLAYRLPPPRSWLTSMTISSACFFASA